MLTFFFFLFAVLELQPLYFSRGSKDPSCSQHNLPEAVPLALQQGAAPKAGPKEQLGLIQTCCSPSMSARQALCTEVLAPKRSATPKLP